MQNKQVTAFWIVWGGYLHRRTTNKTYWWDCRCWKKCQRKDSI